MLARIPRSTLLTAGLGLVSISIWLAVAAPASHDDCDPCSELSGHWFHTMALWVGAVNVVGWLLGAWVGSALARRRVVRNAGPKAS